jgi:hypothetical protein
LLGCTTSACFGFASWKKSKFKFITCSDLLSLSLGNSARKTDNAFRFMVVQVAVQNAAFGNASNAIVIDYAVETKAGGKHCGKHIKQSESFIIRGTETS